MSERILFVILCCASIFVSNSFFLVRFYRDSATFRRSTALNNNSKSKRSKSKDELDSILTGIGLATVPNKNSSTTVKRKQKGTKSSKKGKVGEISLEAQLDYARNGHAVIRDFVDPKTLQVIRKQILDFIKREELKAWKQKVQVATNSPKLAESCKSVTDCRNELQLLGITDIPFLQFFNTWQQIDDVKKLAYDLGYVASKLLDVPKIRLYQDSVFWKRPIDGPTPWHVDAKMAPFDTSHMVTLWIPLNDIPVEGTGLMFVSKSHSDFALPYWNPIHNNDDGGSSSLPKEWDRLEERYLDRIVDYMPLKVGDLTAHSGWTLHCANDNRESNDRIALAISYVDANAELRPDALDDSGKGDNEDLNSYQTWAKSVPKRKRFQHDLVPIVFDAT